MGAYEEYDAVRRRFDVAGSAALLLDGRGVVTSWTRDAQRLLGYTAAEAVGTPFAGLLTAEDAGRVPGMVERCHRGGGWSGLIEARRKDGQPVGVTVRISPWKSPAGPRRRWC